MKPLLKTLLILAIIITPSVVLAQGPPGPPPPGPCWPPPCVPIDGGIGFLIAAGAAFGIKTLWNKK